MAETLGIREYSRKRGCSPAAVRKAIKTGRLARAVSLTPAGLPRIDPDIAAAEWELSTDQAQQRGAAQGQLFGDGRSRAVRGSIAGATFTTHRALREQANARLAELDLEERRGNLVSRQEVTAEAWETGRKVRDRLRAIGARVAGPLSSMRTPPECQELVDREIDLALEELKKLGLDRE